MATFRMPTGQAGGYPISSNDDRSGHDTPNLARGAGANSAIEISAGNPNTGNAAFRLEHNEAKQVRPRVLTSPISLDGRFSDQGGANGA